MLANDAYALEDEGGQHNVVIRGVSRRLTAMDGTRPLILQIYSSETFWIGCTSDVMSLLTVDGGDVWPKP